MQVEGLDIDINKLPVEAKKEFLRYKIKLEEKRKESAIKNDFMSFVKYVWPDFIEGSHHKIMAEKFNKVATGDLKKNCDQYGTATYKIRICILPPAVMDDW